MKRQWIMLRKELSLQQYCIQNAYQKCITEDDSPFFLSIRYTFQFGIIFALINDSPCDSVLFSTILYICMHCIRPAAYLPSAFLGARFAITFSIMTSYIYLFIFLLRHSVPCHANPFLIRSQSLSIFMGI